ESKNIKVSMDSKGRATDNIYIERLWRSLKYENIFINEYNCLKELKQDIEKYFEFYNSERFHQSLAYKTPDKIYYENKKRKAA
ncbi:MAG: integrase core domain-containing protein, partial [Victivallales bacterium]|nr:integrase core domain-containing protein [Victivallales bacterium]